MTVLLAQLTDTHVLDAENAPKGGIDPAHPVDNNGRLAAAVAMLQREPHPPSAVIATGDLTFDGAGSEYEALAELLAPVTQPIYAVPGNHDDRDRFRAHFHQLPWVDAAHASWTLRHLDVTIVGLDTTVPGKPGAAFDDERAAWLDRTLADADAAGLPTLLAMHHPPFLSGLAWMDRSGFVGLERFVEVVARHRVDRILCGHMHRPMVSMVGGTIAQVAPATVQHVALDFDPSPYSDLTLINDPIGYLMYRYADGTWVSHTRYIGTGEEPYRPSWSA